MKIKVKRYDKDTNISRYDIFDLTLKPGMTVLAGLFDIQDNFDDTLAFRYSCRGAVCGTCAMLINKVPRLACRTQINKLITRTEVINLKPYLALEVTTDWNANEEILVEPLPHLPVIKDLIVDMTKFFKHYRAIEPVFKPAGKAPAEDKERLMMPDSVSELEKYTNCILCAACYGACPVNSKAPDYLGPAALAKLYRFYIDPREAQDDSRLKSADTPIGWGGCEFHLNCKRVCPKGVPPNLAIGQARKRLKEMNKG
jgi:succinate dehydrogenase / fumarate reductase iron-sulfur subunit